MDQKIFFILLIIFLVTSEFYLMIRNIIINSGYLFVIMYVFKIINPDISNNIKSFMNTIINTDEKSLMSYVSNGIKKVKQSFNINKLDVLNNLFEDEEKFFSTEVPSN